MCGTRYFWEPLRCERFGGETDRECVPRELITFVEKKLDEHPEGLNRLELAAMASDAGFGENTSHTIRNAITNTTRPIYEEKINKLVVYKMLRKEDL